MEKADQVRLNHELLLWVGFTLTNGVWSYPDGVTVDNGVPYFPESLDECFKWLVPKLGDYPCIKFDFEGKGAIFAYACDSNDKNAFSPLSKTPALALCLAIQKLIRSK